MLLQVQETTPPRLSSYLRYTRLAHQDVQRTLERGGPSRTLGRSTPQEFLRSVDLVRENWMEDAKIRLFFNSIGSIECAATPLADLGD
jgi:hypothetical protein